MDIKAKQKLLADTLPKARGIYIAIPIGERLRPFDKDRESALVNENFVKVGKANNFKQRCRKYVSDNDGDVFFEDIVITDNLTLDQHKKFEVLLKDYFSSYRIRNPSGRKTEWMTGVDPEFVRQKILELFAEYTKKLK
jgi:hypothetical protein